MGQVWERQMGVCSHERLFPFCVCATSLFRAEIRKVGAKSESVPAAGRHSAIPCTVTGFVSLFLFFYCSLTPFLSYTHTHTHTHTHTRTHTDRHIHTHTHTHTQTTRHSWQREDRTTGELLHTFTTSYLPSHHQTLYPGCGCFSWGSPLDYWPPPGRNNFKVRGLCLRSMDGSLFEIFFFKPYSALIVPGWLATLLCCQNSGPDCIVICFLP